MYLFGTQIPMVELSLYMFMGLTVLTVLQLYGTIQTFRTLKELKEKEQKGL